MGREGGKGEFYPTCFLRESHGSQADHALLPNRHGRIETTGALNRQERRNTIEQRTTATTYPVSYGSPDIVDGWQQVS